jgi:hypothetical protein
MVAKEFFVNYYNFNTIWVQHTSIHPCKKLLVIKSKKVIVKVSYKNLLINSEPDLDPKEIFAAPRGWSRSERNNFGSATLAVTDFK